MPIVSSTPSFSGLKMLANTCLNQDRGPSDLQDFNATGTETPGLSVAAPVGTIETDGEMHVDEDENENENEVRGPATTKRTTAGREILGLLAETEHQLPWKDSKPTYCHQCRRTNDHPKMRCCKMIASKSRDCKWRYCRNCVWKRYPTCTFDRQRTDWLCPKCQDTCNCTRCCHLRHEPYHGERVGRRRPISKVITEDIKDDVLSNVIQDVAAAAEAESQWHSKKMVTRLRLRNARDIAQPYAKPAVRASKATRGIASSPTVEVHVLTSGPTMEPESTTPPLHVTARASVLVPPSTPSADASATTPATHSFQSSLTPYYHQSTSPVGSVLSASAFSYSPITPASSLPPERDFEFVNMGVVQGSPSPQIHGTRMVLAARHHVRMSPGMNEEPVRLKEEDDVREGAVLLTSFWIRNNSPSIRMSP